MVTIAEQKYGLSYWKYAHAIRGVFTGLCSPLQHSQDADPRTQRLITFLSLYLDETPMTIITERLGVKRTTLYYTKLRAFELATTELQDYLLQLG